MANQGTREKLQCMHPTMMDVVVLRKPPGLIPRHDIIDECDTDELRTVLL